MDRTKLRDPRIDTPPATPEPATPETAEILQTLLHKKAELDLQKAGLDLQKAELDLLQRKNEQEIHQLQTELQQLEQQAEQKLQAQGPNPRGRGLKTGPCPLNFLQGGRHAIPGQDFSDVGFSIQGVHQTSLKNMLRTLQGMEPLHPITGMPSTSVTTDVENPLPPTSPVPVLNNFPVINQEAMWPHALNILFPMRESASATGSTISEPRQPREGS
jgi:hypothetical protein